MVRERDIFDLDQLNEQEKVSYRHHQKAAHLSCRDLYANETGRINLYSLRESVPYPIF